MARGRGTTLTCEPPGAGEKMGNEDEKTDGQDDVHGLLCGAHILLERVDELLGP